MTGKYPHLSGNEMGDVLKSNGFTKVRQKGSHMIFKDSNKAVTVPHHKEVKVKTLKEIIKQSGLSVDDFIQDKKKDKAR